MNEVFLKTRELGDAIMKSDEFKAMKEAESGAMQNAEAAFYMGQYLERKGQIEKLLAQDEMDGELVKRLSTEMDDFQQKLYLIDEVQRMTRAREAFSGLIEQVNQVLRFIITGEMNAEEKSGCAGSCSSCGGCGHQHMN